MAVLLNKNSFCCIQKTPPIFIKTNLRENRFFAAWLAVGGEKGTHNVKILTKKQTKMMG